MINIIQKARNDRKFCNVLEKSLPDEFAAEGCAYHIEQAIEKQIKAYMLFNGVQFEKKHNIFNLLIALKNNGIDFDDELSEKIEDMADTLFVWETQSRYDPFDSFTIRKYEKALEIYDWLDKYMSRYMSQYLSDKAEKADDEILDLTQNNSMGRK